ncbi:serine/threonine protein kinase, partial [Streptomyces sp. YC537]|nr:serine/threonine protein kinase [Streptomyces boluensis]
HPVGYGHPPPALPSYGPPGPVFGTDDWYARTTGHEQPVPPVRRNGRATVLLIAVAVAVGICAGGSVYALMSGEGTGRTDRPSPTAPPTTGTGRGAIPEAYLGTWRAGFEAGGGTNTRVLTLTQGAPGEQVMRLEGSGPNHDCAWTATLRSATGTALVLGPSKVTRGDPDRCKPGEVSEVTMPDDATLVRELIGSDGTPLTYTR